MTLLAKVVSSPWPLMVFWWLGGLLTIFVPRKKWNNHRDYYYSVYGRYNAYEQQQRQYENGNNYQNNYNPNNAQAYGNFNCGWWQYKCREQQYYYRQMRDNNGGGNQYRTPDWYQFLGGINEEEDRRAREEMGSRFDEAHGAVKFVYAWSIVIFIVLLIFGTYVIYTKNALGHLKFTIAMIIQYSILMLILLPQGVISTDDEDLNDSVYGWYGQLPVLMVFFYYAQILFGVIFFLLIASWSLMMCLVNRKDKGDSDGNAEPKTYYKLWSTKNKPTRATIKDVSDDEASVPEESIAEKVNKLMSAYRGTEVDPSETTAGYSEAAKLNIA